MSTLEDIRGYPPDNHLDDLRADHLSDIRQDGKRDAVQDAIDDAKPDECVECGTKDSAAWTCIGTDPAYGADADGRRGVMLREWECRCGYIEAVTG
jgi:hypothetical protein